MRQVLCLCDQIQPIQTRTRVCILMHVREIPLSTNTAKLAHAFLRQSEIRLRGSKRERLDLSDLAERSNRGETLLYLFPHEGAQVLSPEWVAKLTQPVTLVVPDGNWKQSGKVRDREPALKDSIPVKLPPGPPSQYLLRTEPRPESVCTFEAIARALGELEPEGQKIRSEMERVFYMMVERVLFSRGKLSADQVTTGLPRAAIEESRLAGARSGISG